MSYDSGCLVTEATLADWEVGAPELLLRASILVKSMLYVLLA